MDTTIEIKHNGACVRITQRGERCFFATYGQPTKELIKAIQYLEQVRAPMATASKLIIQEMFK